MYPPPELPWSPKLIQLPESTASQIPSHIIQVFDPDRYLLAFKPKTAGIIEHPPALVLQSSMAQFHPDIVTAWQDKKASQRAEAHEIGKRVQHFGKQYISQYAFARNEDKGGECSQPLMPGMLRHWGEIRMCEAHTLSHAGVRTFAVCKGCRVAHYALYDWNEEKCIAMHRGARLNVCTDCAEKAVSDVTERKVGMCVCEERWMCFQCWERELKELVKLRENNGDERCGRCRNWRECVKYAESCDRCRRWRVYGNGRENDNETQAEIGQRS